jgi:Gram-negative bacterial TonB protein C-terminal
METGDCPLTGRGIVKRSIEVVILLYIAALSCADISAQDATTPSNSDIQKGDAVLVSLSKPVYPPLARQANIYGEVRVAVAVRPDGTATAAVESGHPMLKQAALDSATQSHFECRVAPLCSYTLVYEFKQIEGSDCCSAFSAPVTIEQEPQSTDPQGRPQTHITITAEQICLCDPASTLTRRVRSIKCLYLWKCSVR